MVKIVDFGLAKLAGQTRLTRTGLTAGTVAYMSPEQARGEEVDQRTDIWALGVVLYEMIISELPFPGDYEAAVLYSILNEKPRLMTHLRSDVPRALAAVVNKCLEKGAAKRCPSAADLQLELQRVVRPLDSRAVSGRYRMPRRAHPIPPVAKIAISLGGLMLGLLLLLALPAFRRTVVSKMGFETIPAEKHLAVLPFTNVGGDPTNQAYCDGLMEYLSSMVTQLEQFEGALWVVSSSEVRQRKVAGPSEARRKLAVTLVVTGSVQRVVNRIGVTLNLVDAKTLQNLRSAVLDEPMNNVTVLQDAMVVRLADMLEIELQAGSRRALAAGRTSVPGAYEFYLQGRGYLQRYEKIENLDTAVGLLQRALQADSAYALAYAALGEAYLRKYETTGEARWVEDAVRNCNRAMQLNDRLVSVNITLGMIQLRTGHYQQAVWQFKMALERDPVNADAHRELAIAYEELQDYEKAESTYKKAIALRPAHWAGYNNLGVFYYGRGRYEEAAAQFHRVIELTPDNARAYNNLGGIYMLLERWSKAREMLEHSLKIEPDYVVYSQLGSLNFFHERRYAEAARLYEKALALNSGDYRVWGSLASAYYWAPGERAKARAAYAHAAEIAEAQRMVNPHKATVLSHLADFYAMLGETNKALPLLEQSLALAPSDPTIMATAGETYEHVGQREKALQCIATALKLGHPLGLFERTPALQGLREDERFQRLIEGLGGKRP